MVRAANRRTTHRPKRCGSARIVGLVGISSSVSVRGRPFSAQQRLLCASNEEGPLRIKLAAGRRGLGYRAALVQEVHPAYNPVRPTRARVGPMDSGLTDRSG